MNTLIQLAAGLLPRDVRDRYREEWLADLRDAEEAGVSRAGIVRGAVLFAVTVRRPWPTITLDPLRTRRVAFALALVSAVIGLTWYPGVEFGGNLPAYLAFARSVVDGVVFAVEVVGLLAAVILISIVRGPRAQQFSVWLLVVAALAPIGAATIQRLVVTDPELFVDLYVYPGAVAYAAAAVLIVVSLILRSGPAPARRPRVPVIVGGTAVIAALGLIGWSLASGIWYSRVPLVTNEPFGSPYFEEWLRLKVWFEAQVDAVLFGSAVVVAALVVAVALAGVVRRGAAFRTVTLAAAFVLVWGYVILTQYYALAVSTSPLADASPTVLTLLRFAFVATVFVLVDGIRTPRSTVEIARR